MILAAAVALALQAQSSYAAPGAFAVDVKEEGPDCTTFAPRGNGPRPVILWGNGTRSRVPAYTPMLKHWASHGFFVVAANTNSAGSGKPMLDCLDYAAATYGARLDLSRIGASGHSQGGGGTLMAARDPRIKSTAPIQAYTLGLGFEAPAIAAQHAPMLLLSGGADATAIPDRNQKPVFDGAKVPIFWATLKDSPHTEPANGEAQNGLYRVITTAWFRWTLMGDAAAGGWFRGDPCGLCDDKAWEVNVKNAKVQVDLTGKTPGGPETARQVDFF